ncbi:flavin-binding monooxygenase [Pseudonocardia sulfidoxydans NBRC 16205]|uniref:Flavin-binding monooxygenase n=1 Tax=Pseudonocardia sulfidoxydans NBRC 16205 TaxID=1223511 RepID=A0A511DBS8_9PSEU|nr:NAD(P)/FAD-dependent oxidoreductase [Pseudonocardia sulfidoxydans]GEL22255.1 flavin-binding monooxygenase [Pseudonocardia sulfidoxydans NBRC 16205]
MGADNGETGEAAADVIVIGAGPGGICTAIQLRQAGIDDVLVLEKSAGVGGTWFNNRYPGLACDVSTDLYSFSFFLDHEWVRPFATRAEIVEYMEIAVDRFGVRDTIRLGVHVVSARWDDEAGRWTLLDANGRRWTARVLVGAVGMFNEFVPPAVPGLDTFAGPVTHTAEWADGDLDLLAGRRVSVIGTAASATQVVPTIAPHTGHLSVFQRTSNWVFPKEHGLYTEEQRRARRHDRSVVEAGRAKAARELDELFADLDSEAKIAEQTAIALANLDTVGDPTIREALRPTARLGAQRPLLSSEFYEAFNRPDVTLVTSPIAEITPAAIRTADGTDHPTDHIVLATGYLAHKFLSVVDVVGRDGVALRDKWADGAYAYLGMTVEDFPNLFMLYGPNTNGGSIIDKLETQTRYIVGKTVYLLKNGVHALEVRPEVVTAYNAQLQADIGAVRAWQVEGSRYYRAPSGRVVTQCPYTVVEYDRMTRVDDLEAFAVTLGERT